MSKKRKFRYVYSNLAWSIRKSIVVFRTIVSIRCFGISSERKRSYLYQGATKRQRFAESVVETTLAYTE